MLNYLLLFMVFFPVNIFAMDCGEIFSQDPTLVKTIDSSNSQAGVNEPKSMHEEGRINSSATRYDSQLGSDSSRGYGFEGSANTGPNCDYSGGSTDIF